MLSFAQEYLESLILQQPVAKLEIALQDINKPIGVAEYQLLLPKAELQTLVLNELNATQQENE